MSKSLFIFILSFAIAIQPVAFYPSQAYAQPAAEATKFSTLLKKIVEAKNNFIRNKVFGETPGANASLVPSTAYIEALDRELQTEKESLFSNVRKTLANPTLIPNRDVDKAPIEWEILAMFYQAATEMENLKALNGVLPSPAIWKQKYEFKVQAQNIVDPFFGMAAGAYMKRLRSEESAKFPFYVKFVSHNIEDNFYEFQLNPLMAVTFAEKQMAVASSNDQMLRMAQLTAASQIYDNQLAIHALNRHDLESIPDVSADLKEKFPILQWKRSDYILFNEIQDQFGLVEDLATKKVGALAEKLRKEQLFFFDKETVFKILHIANPTKNTDINAPNIQETLEEIQEFEQSPIFMDHLQALISLTSFKVSQAKEFWTQNIKLTITQAKLAVAESLTLNSARTSAEDRLKIEAVLNERKVTYLNETLRALNVTPIIKYVKDEKTFLSELRHAFQKKLWINAKRMESSLLVENEPVDLTVIADKKFIEYLNENLNKEVVQFKAQPTKGIRADKGVVIDPIQPLTAQWLQTLFQPGQTYGALKETYKQTIFNALKDFKVLDGKAPVASFDPFGTPTEPDVNAIKAWLQNSTYDPNAVKLKQDKLNSIALDLHARAPQARKQELFELIKIGENLGFFLKHNIGETPKVSQMPWTPEWTKAYHAVIKQRIIVENPLLALKLSDTEHESGWASAAFTIPRYLFGHENKEKSLWQELAPLYTNEMEETDERADALVTIYLNKMQDIITKDLLFVGEEGAKAQVSLVNPWSWRLIGREKPYEFSSQFKKIIARSSILTVKLHKYSHFQSHLLKLQQDMEYDSAEAKAYEHVFNYYVMYGFMASILFSVAGQIAKHASQKGLALFQMFEKEALAPVLGPNLKYYNNTALIWLGLDLAGSGIDTFGAQKNLRDRTSDMAFSSAMGPGLIDMNMKNLSDGLYNNAQLKWWTQVGLLIVVGGAIALGMYSIPRITKWVSNRKTTTEFVELKPWADKVTRWADNVGFQKDLKTGELQVGLLKGDIEAMADASRAQISIRMGKAKENPAHIEAMIANVNMSAQQLEMEASRAAQMWLEIGQKQYTYQFKSLRMEPGQWDIVLLNQRAKDIELALQRKQISREQAWVLKQNLSELQNAFGSYAEAMLNIPGVGPALLERIASTTSKVQFDSTGRVIGYNGKRMPEIWWQQVKALQKHYPKEDDAFFHMLYYRAKMNNLEWVKDGNAMLPSRQSLYDIESKRKFVDAYIKAVQTPSQGFK